MRLISPAFQTRFSSAVRDAQGAVDASVERLSLGRRIVRAADDPAGLAVATNLRVAARSRQAAQRNVGDALQMAAMADGGLREFVAVLTRMRELAVQAASETLDDTSRSYLDDEVQALLDTLDYQAQNTLYNGQVVLSNPGVDVGLLIDTSGSMYGEIQRVRESIADFEQSFLDARYNVQIGLAEFRNTADNLDNVVRHTQIGAAGLEDALANLTTVGGSIDPWAALTETSGLTRIVGAVEPDSFTFRSGTVKIQILITDSARQADFLDGATQAEVAADLARADIQVHAIIPSTVSADYSTLTSVTGGDMHDIGNSGGSGIPDALDAISEAILAQLDQDAAISVQADIDRGDSLETSLPVDVSVLSLGLSDLSLGTAADARAGLDLLDGALATVGRGFSAVGATQRRLESILRQHDTTLEAESAAASRIEDLDYAKETARLTGAQIRLQAVLAVGAQAQRLDREAVEGLLPG